jgi:hypothetical protein
MIKCDRVQALIKDPGVPSLSDDLAGEVFDHIADCEPCLAVFERASLICAAIEETVSDMPEAGTVPEQQGRSRPDNRTVWGIFANSARRIAASRPIRLIGIPVFACGGLALAGWFAAPLVSAWRFPGGDARPIKESIQLLQESTPRSGPAEESANAIGPWKIECDPPLPGFATLDASVTNSGEPSLKLIQRSASGRLEQNIPVPLPSGTEIKLGAWIYSPRGGSPDNKYFAMGVSTPGIGNVASIDILDASPVWRPYILSTVLTKPTTSISLTLTMTGNGTYEGWDWATWVDDVFVGISMPLSGTCRQIQDSLVIDARVPEGFDTSNLSESVQFNAVYDPPNEIAHNISGRVIKGTDHRTFRVVIDSPVAIDALTMENPDTHGPASGSVAGRLQYGSYSVPFYIPLTGPPLISQ